MTLDDLDGLIRNPAWQELCLEVRRRWSTHLEEGVASCVEDPDDSAALGKLRQLVAAKREAEAIIAWGRPLHRAVTGGDRMTLDDLDGLIRNPAWQELCLEARRRWSTHLEEGVASCVEDPDDSAALGKLRQLVAAKREAEAIIAWPVEATRRLKHSGKMGAAQGRPR